MGATHVGALYRYPVKGSRPSRWNPRRSRADQGGSRATGCWPSVRRRHRPGVRRTRLLAEVGTRPARTSLSLAARLRPRQAADRDGEAVVAGLTKAERRRISPTRCEWCSAPGGHGRRPSGRLPLELLGDGTTARFQDRARGRVAARRASVQALGGRPASARRPPVPVRTSPRWKRTARVEELAQAADAALGDRLEGMRSSHRPVSGDHRQPGHQRAQMRKPCAPRVRRLVTLGTLLLPADPGGRFRASGDPVCAVTGPGFHGSAPCSATLRVRPRAVGSASRADARRALGSSWGFDDDVETSRDRRHRRHLHDPRLFNWLFEGGRDHGSRRTLVGDHIDVVGLHLHHHGEDLLLWDRHQVRACAARGQMRVQHHDRRPARTGERAPPGTADGCVGGHRPRLMILDEVLATLTRLRARRRSRSCRWRPSR